MKKIKRIREGAMQTTKDMREQAERCVRLAGSTLDDSVAAALLAYAGELEQRARLIERNRAHVRLGPIPPARALATLATVSRDQRRSARACRRAPP